jgi:AraC-like DNA-binding protein
VQLHVHERAGAGEPPDALVSEAVRGLMPWRTADVASLTVSLYISETQLRRRCRTAVGLAPKALHRMLRFQGFLALVQQAIAQGRAATDDGLALLALRAGYADQSHLTRECVRLTGVSPRVFLAETQQACACGHDHSASFAPVLRAETETRLTREYHGPAGGSRWAVALADSTLVAHARWVHAEARRADGGMVAFTNPIWLGRP